MIKISKGLDLPITGTPIQEISGDLNSQFVGVVGTDFVGMKPSMNVAVGDTVKKGQLLFECKKTPGVRYTSPASGKIVAINRGAKRAFESIEIERVSGDESVSFSSHKGSDISTYDRQAVIDLLLESGEWTAIRQRPYSKVPDPTSEASSLFITAVDTHPLAPNPDVIIGKNEEAFYTGVDFLNKLTPKVFLCVGAGSKVKSQTSGVTVHEFNGPHPAGLVGTHIHFLDPVSENKTVWHIGYQDVIAIGQLVATGQLYTKRYVSIAGPVAKTPRIVQTEVGVKISEIVQHEVEGSSEVRSVSGSVFGGRHAIASFDYLGRFHNQVTLLEEGRHREFMGWHSPGFDRYSVKPIYLSRLMNKKFNFHTNTNGSYRSIVPIGSFEKVMPLDILPTQLLRYLMSENNEMCVKLGALELDEEDLSLCTFVDPCKNDYQTALREKLTIIEKEG